MLIVTIPMKISKILFNGRKEEKKSFFKIVLIFYFFILPLSIYTCSTEFFFSWNIFQPLFNFKGRKTNIVLSNEPFM